MTIYFNLHFYANQPHVVVMLAVEQHGEESQALASESLCKKAGGGGGINFSIQCRARQGVG